MSDLRIIYEDKHLIAVVKPYNILSQGNEKTHSMCDEISHYLSEKGEKSDVFVVHRLDKTTGGVMVYAKTKAMAGKLSALITKGEFHKTYLCVISGEMSEETSKLSDLLFHDKNKNKTFVVKRERKGVKKAELSYETLGVKKRHGDVMSLLKVRLYTGRTHQIRVQFSSRKHPLIGDRKYGSSVKSENIALWSYMIEFVHPVSGEKMSLKAKSDAEIFSTFE
ncbi:MAG: RluA family pseudouridine synthase [Ruminococcus sp.]|nr:RluA family pseudouridine synthase [Ruminococcus sp.]